MQITNACERRKEIQRIFSLEIRASKTYDLFSQSVPALQEDRVGYAVGRRS